jgi:hypothetical protein
MNTDTVIRLLRNSGFYGIVVNTDSVIVEDPSCIIRSFEIFAHYAWIAISVLTGLLFAGWGVSMIRGAQHDFFTNMRNLALILGILTATGPIINYVYGDDLFARGCRQITIPIADINRMLAAREEKLAERDQMDLYEEFDIYDSGADYYNLPIHQQSYADAPATSAGEPVELRLE